MNTKIFSHLPQINQKLNQVASTDVLAWAWRTFGEDMIATSSFQTQSIPLLHFISQAVPDLTVVFVDTGFHFPETLQFRDQVVRLFNLRLKVVEPQIKGDDFLSIFGPLYAQSADACCFYNKVAPFQMALKNYSAWISGIRRDQTTNRVNTPVVGQHPFLPVYKINPMTNWSEQDIEKYIENHNLPRHPLYKTGYRSIGCKPCTKPVADEERSRNGRWPNLLKNECGMHEGK